MRVPAQSLWRIFKLPLAALLLSVAGLSTALVVEGPADLLAVSAASTPVIVMVWLMLRQRR